MKKVYEVNFTIQIQEFIEAESHLDARQEFSEMFSTDELLDYGVFTVTETDQEVFE